MGSCVCTYTRDEDKNCDGTHKVVKAVREQIAKEIEAIDLGGSSQMNGLGVRMIATKIARGS